MAGIKHAFTSGKSDGGDATLVRPSNWNADHVFPTPTIVQTKFAGNAVSSITLDSTPIVGHSIILALDGFNTGQATSVSSTNTTWTQMKIFNNAGGQKAAIWIGICSASPGAAITITHPNSFMSARATEIVETLTPTLGANTSSEASTTAMLTGVTVGNLVIASGGTDNSTLSNGMTAGGFIPSGAVGGIVALAMGYALATVVSAAFFSNPGALILIEVS
jgi:hypothetical protein